MSGFGHYGHTAKELESEIASCGVLVKVDWTDPVQVRALAEEALGCTPERRLAMLHDPDEKVKARGRLFALSELMLDIMRQGAQTGVRVPCVGVWEKFDLALADASKALRPERLEGNS